jgi:hypothetical protein
MQRLCFGMGENSHAMKPGSSISESPRDFVSKSSCNAGSGALVFMS